MTAAEESPAGKVMSEAIKLSIEGRSPYPENAAFINADCPEERELLERTMDDDFSIVVVSSDGSTRILPPGSSAS